MHRFRNENELLETKDSHMSRIRLKQQHKILTSPIPFHDPVKM